MELYQLEYFRVLCKYGSYTKAANHLFITQPAITTAMKKLEQECGTPLIDKTNRVFTLTPVGKALLRHVENIHTEIKNIEIALSEYKNGFRDVINIALPLTMCPGILLDISVKFIPDHPELNIFCSQTGPEAIVQGIEDGSFDMGVSCANLCRDTIEAQALMQVEFCAFFSVNHEFNDFDCITPGMLADQQLLVPQNATDGITKSFHTYFAENNIKPECRCIGNIVPYDVHILAKQGKSVALLPMHISAEHRKRLDPPLFIDLSVMWRKGITFTKGRQKLLHFLCSRNT